MLAQLACGEVRPQGARGVGVATAARVARQAGQAWPLVRRSATTWTAEVSIVDVDTRRVSRESATIKL